MNRTGFPIAAPGTTQYGQRGRQQQNGVGQKQHSLMNQTMGPRSGVGSGLGKNSIFGSSTPAPPIGNRRANTKGAAGRGQTNDLRSVLNTSGGQA